MSGFSKDITGAPPGATGATGATSATKRSTLAQSNPVLEARGLAHAARENPPKRKQKSDCRAAFERNVLLAAAFAAEQRAQRAQRALSPAKWSYIDIEATKAARAIASKLGLPPSQRLVLLALAKFHNHDTRRCNPNLESLIEVTGLARSTMFLVLGDLRERGLIDWRSTRAGGNQVSNRYKLAFAPKPGAAPQRGGLDFKATKAAFKVGAALELTPSQRLVLLALAKFHNHVTKACNPSHAELEAETGLSNSSVRRSLAQLKALSLLDWRRDRSGARQGSNQYELSFSDAHHRTLTTPTIGL